MQEWFHLQTLHYSLSFGYLCKIVLTWGPFRFTLDISVSRWCYSLSNCFWGFEPSFFLNNKSNCHSCIFFLLPSHDKLKEKLVCHQQTPPSHIHTHPKHTSLSFICFPVLSYRWWKGWAGGSHEGITVTSYINTTTPHLDISLSHIHTHTRAHTQSWCNRSIMFDFPPGTAFWLLWLPSPPPSSLVIECVHNTHAQACTNNTHKYTLNHTHPHTQSCHNSDS